MFSTSVLLPALLCLASGLVLTGSDASSLYSHSQYTVPYQGPPAPLNHDGTVANTPEVQHAISAHHAAVAQEYQRLHETEKLAAAHPELTSPSGNIYGSSYGGQYYQKYDNGAQYNTANAYSTNNNNLFNTAQHSYSTANNNLYNTPNYNQGKSYRHNPQAHIPAPLNHDGTVAQTPEYLAIAATHHAEYQRAVQRNKYQSLPSHEHGYY